MEKMYRMKTCLAALGLLLVCGCANVYYEKLSYLSPGNGGIAVRADAKAKLIVSGEQQLAQGTAKSIIEALNKKDVKCLRIATGADEAIDYYIFVNVTTGYKVSSQKSVPFNKARRLVENDGENGGYDVLTDDPGLPDASGSLYAAVAIYAINSLDPLSYFEVTANEGAFGDKAGQVRAKEEFASKFVAEIGRKFSDMTSTQHRDFDTAIPKHADGSMVRALKKGDIDKVDLRAKNLVPESFDDFIAKVKSEKNPKKLTPGLCCLYIMTLTQELNNFDIENLRKLYKRYYQIMLVAEDEGLAEACASSLARIEKKAAMTGNKI